MSVASLHCTSFDEQALLRLHPSSDRELPSPLRVYVVVGVVVVVPLSSSSSSSSYDNNNNNKKTSVVGGGTCGSFSSVRSADHRGAPTKDLVLMIIYK